MLQEFERHEEIASFYEPIIQQADEKTLRQILRAALNTAMQSQHEQTAQTLFYETRVKRCERTTTENKE